KVSNDPDAPRRAQNPKSQTTRITLIIQMEFTFQRTYRGPLKAVLLDWAGTTMDYGCFAPAVVFMEVFKRKGVEITIEEAREPMGAHKKVHIRQISQNDNVAKKWQQAHKRKPNEEDIETMFREFIPLQL